MSNHDRIEDIEQRIYLAYQEGNYQEAKSLEIKLSRLRGRSNLYDDQGPYSLEGRTYLDDDQ
ncbi:hypothetical protein ACFFLZ_04910 [Photobacterium aphoticum]|uniref:Uncharacterized protein n=1 Tax=Photobacterium aphoticum TaxID=754436 RepID=A0A090QI26_9GAMM|nr:hypothetical protein [Photobacterium aphoticum]KLV01759.1 hypothetical protein ABT58_04820 [Photobacterium aphoticum]PSU58759.1 hypothetical protein C9I90_05940 [Photobacterium aphoticum]GAL02556.1 hypothetical protein JCM19237_5449 [Photobacterium aphoticum]GHA32190.1 hypothetical protein GCM10007086_01640 [Photobacterium aphoticum]